MCGFFGFLRNPQKNDLNFWDRNHQLFVDATDMIVHRGPDSMGVYNDDHVFMGFRRLSIIDLEGGSQPLSYDNERYWITFNGEIYNYLELKEELLEKGYQFATDSDTEVLLACFKEYGTEMVEHIRGMYAFLIWDKETESLFGARDHFGIKPLYYSKTPYGILFASEWKSIEHVRNAWKIPNELDVEAVQHYFTYQYPPEPFTFEEGSKKLSPGTAFVIMEGEMREFTYFKPTFSPEKKVHNELKKEVLDAMRESVKMHMRSDVPVGSFLSGGIDSTLIAALAKEFHPSIKTFTVGFEREGFSEIDVAKETAVALGLENIHKVITAEEFLEELPNVVWHMDEPVADPASIPLYFVAKEARKHVTVVLSGEGADELFGGYTIYREPLSLKKAAAVPLPVRKGIYKAMKWSNVKGMNYLRRSITPLEKRFIGNANIMNEQEKRELLTHYSPNWTYDQVTKPLYAEAHTYDEPTKMQYVDMHTWMRGDILVKADRMTMAHSLELRVPFLDKEVFALARKIETKYKLAEGTTKKILREAAEEVVPAHVLNRRKLGFPVPIRHWLKNEWYNWVSELFNMHKDHPYLHMSIAQGWLEDHKQGKCDYSRKIWNVVIFLLWNMIHMEDMAKEEVQSLILKMHKQEPVAN
ncbi:asparagine synthase (glutamine-hydrolyzing) [Bacillus cereus]|uniref:asparagine synthase (glutamine-hydrolyzing) n=1 Tax=Bacillus cereus TaxID=1396 RepID=A0A164QNW9_BACCE|nr:asparagine synthase (glutamine-hydrolyzing) [Bacillus cereus]KZD71970.1 Asparagine synthetase (glutamine-hydrolyzing) [Bacillus cereus]HDR8322080.1 asparagine synthase (glutamine-hydrolyzing) [Bacillus cereus]HDR8328630.1 asparagine synthase (glutamine-hydrolyzing) [Bacillus cereus]HDR8334266.1 asparagine synthase (glutamine-hydrolyzing) [Bacillus cereus]